MRLERYGLSADLPPGWDGRLYRRAPEDAGATTHPVLHAGDFPLPAERGDFGSGAVEQMGASNVFVALVEYHPDSAATPLFGRQGLPRRLRAASFSPAKLQRRIPGQGGSQFFFSSGGRAYCLYVVLGSYANREVLLPRVNGLLATLGIDPLPRAAPSEGAT